LETLLKASNVKKKYGEYEALRGVDFSILQAEQVAIQGASGSGKSTLLYLLGGLDIPSFGDIYWKSKKLSDFADSDLARYRNEQIGFVFQFHFLLSSISCLQNILLPGRIGGANVQEVEERIRPLAKYLGVEQCLPKFPHQISGGEQQRINILRAISLHPSILLCDEPTGNLDSKNSGKVIELLRELSLKFKASLIVVTHDNSIASQFSKKHFMSDGKIIEQ